VFGGKGGSKSDGNDEGEDADGGDDGSGLLRTSKSFKVYGTFAF
jgi:hypothetical protein